MWMASSMAALWMLPSLISAKLLSDVPWLLVVDVASSASVGVDGSSTTGLTSRRAMEPS